MTALGIGAPERLETLFGYLIFEKYYRTNIGSLRDQKIDS
jgi:hypothetical protein